MLSIDDVQLATGGVSYVYCVCLGLSPDGVLESRVIKAHKFVLMSRSPVFSAMTRWSAPDDDSSIEIVLDDADPNAVYRVLKYV